MRKTLSALPASAFSAAISKNASELDSLRFAIVANMTGRPLLHGQRHQSLKLSRYIAMDSGLDAISVFSDTGDDQFLIMRINADTCTITPSRGV